MERIISTQTIWDRIGISLSGFCAIHCLFFPVALALLPLWPVAESIHAWTHPILFILIVPTVFLALRNKSLFSAVSYFLFSGLAVIALAWILHNIVGDWGEAVITMAGSALLVAGHLMNYNEHRKPRGVVTE